MDLSQAGRDVFTEHIQLQREAIETAKRTWRELRENMPAADGDWVLWPLEPPATPEVSDQHRAEQDAPFRGS